MMGKTHIKIGILYYVLIGVLPLGTFLALFEYKISLIGALTAAFGACLPDADCLNSNINKMNPLLGITYKAMEKVEKKILVIARCLLTFSAGTLILYYAGQITTYIRLIPPLAPYAVYITYGLAVFIIAAGLSNKKIIKHIPIIGWIYTGISLGIYRAGRALKRVIMIMVYAGAGIAMIIYNYLYLNDIFVYIIGGLFICIALFPHRTLLHSIEGIILFTMAFGYAAKYLGYAYLTIPFFIGYFSHLYLADLFTKGGVPLSIIPFIFRKLKVHNYMRKSVVYRCIYNILNIKLRVPVISTGTGLGYLMEIVYIGSILVIIVLILFKINPNNNF